MTRNLYGMAVCETQMKRGDLGPSTIRISQDSWICIVSPGGRDFERKQGVVYARPRCLEARKNLVGEWGRGFAMQQSQLPADLCSQNEDQNPAEYISTEIPIYATASLFVN